MSSESKIVVFIGQGRIEAQSLGDHQAEFSAQWESRTLSQVLSQLKTKLKATSLQVIIGDNLSFLTPVFIPSSDKDLKDKVLEEAAKVLPESLDDLGVDWKQVYQAEGMTAVQLFAVQKPFLSLLGRATQSAGLKIESIEPVAYVLSRVVPDSSDAVMVIWEDDVTEAAVIHQGQVLASTQITDLSVYSAIESLLSLVQDKYGLNVDSIVMPTKAKKISKDKLAEKTGKKVIAKDFDLMATAANKADIKGDDEDVLNITPKEVFAEEESMPEISPDPEDDQSVQESADQEVSDSSDDQSMPEIKPMAPKLPKMSQTENPPDEPEEPQPISAMETKSKPPFPTKLVVLAFFLLAIVTTVVIGGVIVYKNAIVGRTSSSQSFQATPEPTRTPEATPTPTPATEIDRTQVKIQVLNGSGIKGLASKVVAALEKAGYQDVKSGNADNFDHTKTEASTGSDNQALLDLVSADLKDSYPIATTDTNLKSSSFDVVITLGQDLEGN